MYYLVTNLIFLVCTSFLFGVTWGQGNPADLWAIASLFFFLAIVYRFLELFKKIL